MREYLIYLAARAVILIAAVAAVWIFSDGFNFIGLLLAVVISSLVSYLLLARLRENATQALADRMAARAAKKAQAPKKNTDESAEDAALDRHLREDS